MNINIYEYVKRGNKYMHRFLRARIQIIQMPHCPLDGGKFFIIYARGMIFLFYNLKRVCFYYDRLFQSYRLQTHKLIYWRTSLRFCDFYFFLDSSYFKTSKTLKPEVETCTNDRVPLVYKTKKKQKKWIWRV